MINPHQPRDIPQILLSVLFLALIIISCLWVVQPFILSFAWAGTVVIATWPVLLRLQRVLFGKRMLAVLAMTLLLFCYSLFLSLCWSTAWWITAFR